jgi:predicted N-acetyltransferase YhbS
MKHNWSMLFARPPNQTFLSLLLLMIKRLVTSSLVLYRSAGKSRAQWVWLRWPVLPDYQKQGVGSQLVRAGLRECARLGYDVVVVLGHAEYYSRFGFIPASQKGLQSEYPVPDEVFMVVELKPDALGGRRGLVKYRPEFNL